MSSSSGVIPLSRDAIFALIASSFSLSLSNGLIASLILFCSSLISTRFDFICSTCLIAFADASFSALSSASFSAYSGVPTSFASIFSFFAKVAFATFSIAGRLVEMSLSSAVRVSNFATALMYPLLLQSFKPFFLLASLVISLRISLFISNVVAITPFTQADVAITCP